MTLWSKLQASAGLSVKQRMRATETKSSHGLNVYAHRQILNSHISTGLLSQYLTLDVRVGAPLPPPSPNFNVGANSALVFFYFTRHARPNIAIGGRGG